jgi:hypothetical protein
VATPKVDVTFQVSDAMLSDFKEYLRSPQPGPALRFTDKDFADNLEYVKTKLRQEVLYSMNYLQEAAKVGLEIDPQVLKAIELIPKAKELQTQRARGIAGNGAEERPARSAVAASR